MKDILPTIIIHQGDRMVHQGDRMVHQEHHHVIHQADHVIHQVDADRRISIVGKIIHCQMIIIKIILQKDDRASSILPMA
jgi:hypothetical protein